MEPKVSIILLNWNGWEDTIECLESLYQMKYQNFNIIIVDNNSEDESITNLKGYASGKNSYYEINNTNKSSKRLSEMKIESITKKLVIIRNDKNYGFAAGNNIGIKFAIKNFNPDYILLLNNDTVVTKSFLSYLIEFMKKNEDVGICNPIQYSYFEEKTVITAGVTIDKLGRGYLNLRGVKNPKFKRPFETTYASGACFLIRTNLLRDLNYLDERLFLGAEDMDTSLGSWIRGKKVVVVSDSIIYHKHSLSVKKKPIDWLVYYGVRGILRCYLKNLQKRTLIIILPIFLLFQVSSFILDLIKRKDHKLAYSRLKAIFWNVLNIENTLIERKNIQKNRIFPDSAFIGLKDWKNVL